MSVWSFIIRPNYFVFHLSGGRGISNAFLFVVDQLLFFFLLVCVCLIVYFFELSCCIVVIGIPLDSYIIMLHPISGYVLS